MVDEDSLFFLQSAEAEGACQASAPVSTARDWNEGLPLHASGITIYHHSSWIPSSTVQASPRTNYAGLIDSVPSIRSFSMLEDKRPERKMYSYFYMGTSKHIYN